MNDLCLMHYCHLDCEPFQNILRLPQEEAFSLAAQLASAHPGATAFHRFADFINYYPRRMETDRRLRAAFISRGGQPSETHPLSFTLQTNDYLDAWFGHGRVYELPLICIPEEQISFTLGDSMSTLEKQGSFTLLTIRDLQDRILAHPEGTAGFLRDAAQQHTYIEAQLWDNAPCRLARRLR